MVSLNLNYEIELAWDALCQCHCRLKHVGFYVCQLAADQRKEADRKEQERRQNQRTSVDFVRATQLVTSQKGAWGFFRIHGRRTSYVV